MLNSELDIQALANQYQQDNRVRAKNILKPDVSEQVATCCETKVPFDFIYHLNGENKVTSAKDMAATNIDEQKSMHSDLMQAGSQGIGFLYCGYMMNRPGVEPDPELAALHDLHQYLGSEEALSVFRKVTGIDELSGIDA
ncbi:MAG: hypothetical protein GKR91_18955 [Pseudomonadales bacterium]|nr:hypothetical protein [Pseudomonadales bacterium]